MMGSIGSPLRGEEAERIVARELNEPIGDSGLPWQGDVVSREYLTDFEEKQLPYIDLNQAEEKIKRFEDKENPKKQDWDNLQELRQELEKADNIIELNRLISRIDELFRNRWR